MNETKGQHVVEPARAIDVVLETDVLVVGSGPGGLAAALAAARAGARTALIDRNGCFGGNITQVGVEGFAWYRHEHTVDCEGIGIEFEERAKAMGAAMPEPQSLSHALDAEMFKWVADVLVEEAGVTPLLHRLGVAPIMDGGVIRGVITESKAGREAILAKRVIDATGDADIATRAGAPVHKAPKEQMMAVSVMFSMSGVNKREFIEAVKADPQTYGDWSGNGEWDYETTGKEDKLFSPFLRKPFKQALAAGIIPPNLQTIAGTWGTVTDQGDLTYLNLVHVPNIDGTDPNDLTARRDARPPRSHLRARGAARIHARLRGREAAQFRHDARHPRHAQDRRALQPHRRGRARTRRRFEDAIGIFPGIHRRLRRPDPADHRAATGRCPTARWCPRASAICWSPAAASAATSSRHASARNMMCCAVTGQGAGVAAAISAAARRAARPAGHRRRADGAAPPGRPDQLI